MKRDYYNNCLISLLVLHFFSLTKCCEVQNLNLNKDRCNEFMFNLKYLCITNPIERKLDFKIVKGELFKKYLKKDEDPY